MLQRGGRTSQAGSPTVSQQQSQSQGQQMCTPSHSRGSMGRRTDSGEVLTLVVCLRTAEPHLHLHLSNPHLAERVKLAGVPGTLPTTRSCKCRPCISVIWTPCAAKAP